MSSCKDCKWSSTYFRGLLCHWVEKNAPIEVPPYLDIHMENLYPYMLDKQDLGEECLVYEELEEKHIHVFEHDRVDGWESCSCGATRRIGIDYK